MTGWREWLLPSPAVVVMVVAITVLGIWCSRNFDEDSAEWMTAFFGGLVGLSVLALAVLGACWYFFG